MADITATDLLTHRRMLQCRRADLGVKIDNKLSQGAKIDCEELKMKRIDTLLCVIGRYSTTATLNCLTSAQVCGIIKYLYTLLPEAC